MVSLPATIIKRIFHLQNYGWAKGSIEEQRARQKALVKFFKVPKITKIDHLDIKGLPAVMLAPEKSREGVILYFHGGAYTLGSIDTHLEYLSRLAITTNLNVLAIDYRLAPEDPFPAAVEDARTAYQWLAENGFQPERIAVAGDSAGGGLAISTLLWLRDHQVPLPACVVCISPWLDLTLSGESIRTNASMDPILNPSILSNYANYYAGMNRKDLPHISPLFAELEGLPPILLHSGTDEILLDDTLRFFEKARSSGVQVTMEAWEGLFHVFPMIPFLPESNQSIILISEFIHSQFEKMDAA